MRRKAIYVLPMKILMPVFYSLTLISLRFQGTIFRRFEDVFCSVFAFDMLTVRHISASGLFDLLTYSVSYVLPLNRPMQISTKCEVDKTVHCLSFSPCWYVTWWCDLDLWPFDPGQWSYMAGHLINPSAKFEDSMAIVHDCYEFWH